MRNKKMRLNGKNIEPPIYQYMQHPEDIVSDTIMESAKTRFDYHEFESVFSNMGRADLPETILRLTIEGYAMEHSAEEIVADINRQINHELALYAVRFPEADLRRFVKEKKAELKREVLAAIVAVGLFEQGAKPPGVLVQVRSILEKPIEAA
jgi:hypothetical protein